MALDPRRIIRVRAAVAAATEDSSPSTSVLMDLYTTSRNQILEMLEDDELVDEFSSLLPGWTDAPGSDLGRAIGASGVTAHAARLRLRTLVGWLDGLIESLRYDAQIAANAEAYAREVVRSERGIGFRPGAEG